MVGRLNDIVTAAVVVNATEKVSSMQPSSQSDSLQTANVTKTQNTQTENDSLFEKDEQDEIHIEPGSVNENTISYMTSELNKLMSKVNYNLQFDYHQFEDVMTVQMIDKETDEVIKEMPPEELVEDIMRAKVWLGAFIDSSF